MKKQLFLFIITCTAGTVFAMETDAQKATTKAVRVALARQIFHASTTTGLQQAQQQLINVRNQLSPQAFQYLMAIANTRLEQLILRNML